MPPLFTSTSIGGLLRQIISVAKHANQPIAVKATMSRTKAAQTINTLQKTRNALNNLAHQTFPSLSTPAHQLQHATIPIRNNIARRGFASATSATTSSHASRAAGRVGGSVRQAIYGSGARPKWTHGPSISANVGLGSARTFASGPSGTVQAKAPMALRALASLLDDEDKKGLRPLPRASRYKPYSRSVRTQRRERRTTCSSIDSSFIKEIQHYFPLVTRSTETVEIALPPTPETLVTEGKTTILALPLSPSLEALLAPSASLHYSETAIGIHILARLTAGFFPIHNAFSLHSSTRIIPLLTKLDGLGVLDYHPASPRTEAEVVNDGEGRPDILRLVFHDRSKSDILSLLGESLRQTEEGEWWALYEEDVTMALTSGERKEIMEQWGERPACPTINTVDRNESESLIFPTLDMSVAPELQLNSASVIFDASSEFDDSPSFTPTSWPSSGVTTPSPIDSPVSEVEYGAGSGSLTASLLSRLAESDVSSEDGVWSVHPSDSDSDVESAFAESEEWGEVSLQLSRASEVENVDELEDQGGSVYSNWTGSGEGFGFLAQPW